MYITWLTFHKILSKFDWIIPLFMPRHEKVAGYYVIPSEILSVRPSVRLSVCLSVHPSVHPSVRPSAPTTILVSATPPTVLGQSFWNFTGVLRMVLRYAYCFFRILKLFFITFFAFLTWTFFEPLYCRYVYGVCTLYRQLLLQFLANPFETLQVF